MLTNGYAWAERTAPSIRPIENSSLPDVWKALWTMVTWPPDLAVAARPDENVAKVHVELFMPLFLQLVSKQADVERNLFTLLFLQLLLAYSVSAAADARGYLCRPQCMRQKWRGIQDKLKD
jgi:hypothetical protein